MGILDGPGLPSGAITPNTLVAALRRGVTSPVLVILGDSTGNETTEWLYLTLQSLAAEFPAYTVTHALWNDTNQSYDAATTIQTGTGSQSLTVYNGSVPGVGYDYPIASGTTRITSMFPAAPTTVLLSFGYNAGTASYRTEMFSVCRAIESYYPTADIILVAQPPKATSAPDHTNSRLRSESVRALALDEGYGLIDATQAFLDYGNYDTLIQGDTVHPTSAGSQVWAREAIRTLRRRPTVSQPTGSGARNFRRWVSAAQFVVAGGSPTLGYVNTYPAWTFHDAATDEVATTVDLPAGWNQANVYLAWFTPNTSGAVTWNVRYGSVANYLGTVSNTTLALSSVAGPITSAAISPANTMRLLKVYDSAAGLTSGRVREGRPLNVKVTRDGTAGTDTLTGDAVLAGLLFERAN